MSVNYVGKYKISPRRDDTAHTWGGGSMPCESSAIPSQERTGLARTTAETLYFQLKEFDEFRQPSFNVLYVETPRPEWKRNPLMEQLSGVVAETAEMLAPLSRLLIPKNSLRDKLPYFREDFSPLPNNVRPRVQKVLRSNVEFAEQQAKLAQAADEYMKAKREGKDVPIPPELLKAGRQHTPHFPEPHFITGEMPSWVVPALNISAYIYLCGFWGIGKDLFK